MLRGLPLVLVCLAARSASAAPPLAWRSIQKGVDYATVAPSSATPGKKYPLAIVRIDAAVAHLVFALASARDQKPRTAKEWCASVGLSVAINAGMFKDDHLANVGRLVTGAHENNARWSDAYQSALVFDPSAPTLPAAVMLDLDDAGGRAQASHYRSVVQNLRLVRSTDGKGRSVWSEQPRKWSEAAIAFDDQGRVLFLFSRTPYSMIEFNRIVLGLPLGVVRAMHVEGGPEASLSIHGGGVDLDYFGSYETGFVNDDSNAEAWAIPNVLGVARPNADQLAASDRSR
jgi:hypothetical protein